MIDSATTVTQQVVHIIRTGIASGLSAPINFDSIKSEISTGNSDLNMIVITLPITIKFIMDLEARES